MGINSHGVPFKFLCILCGLLIHENLLNFTLYCVVLATQIMKLLTTLAVSALHSLLEIYDRHLVINGASGRGR